MIIAHLQNRFTLSITSQLSIKTFSKGAAFTVLKMKYHEIVISLLIIAFSTTALASGTRDLGWTDLVKQISFEDPFEALTSEQLSQLGLYARIRSLLENSPDRVSESMQQEATEVEQLLRSAGIDIEGLLAQREEIKELRKQSAFAVVEKLDGQHIRMPGFALPLEFSGSKITEFLLVPWVGACIHTPPPPPNQIVFVTIEDGFESKGQFTPVWVSGEMKVQSATKDLYLVDGSAGIDTGYTLIAQSVSDYRK